LLDSLLQEKSPKNDRRITVWSYSSASGSDYSEGLGYINIQVKIVTKSRD